MNQFMMNKSCIYFFKMYKMKANGQIMHPYFVLGPNSYDIWFQMLKKKILFEYFVTTML